jgi:hypothetical protein
MADWEPLVKAAIHDRLAGLVYTRLYRAGLLDRIAPAQAQALYRTYSRTAAENLVRIHELREIRTAAHQAGIPFVLLKGMALLATVYADIGLRPMDDMDLWVRPQDRRRFAALLADAGYRQDPLYPDTFQKGRVVVDLHTHPLGADRIRSRKYLIRDNSVALFSRAAPVRLSENIFLCPAEFDQLVLLSIHAFKHGLQRMSWMADVLHLTAGWHAQKWREFARRCENNGESRSFGGIVTIVEALQGRRWPFPEEAGRLKNHLGRWDRKLILLRRDRPQLPFYIAVWSMRPESWPVKTVAFFLETLMPRPSVLRRSFPAFSKFPAPFLYALRIAQLLIVLFRRIGFARSNEVSQRPPAEPSKRKRPLVE